MHGKSNRRVLLEDLIVIFAQKLSVLLCFIYYSLGKLVKIDIGLDSKWSKLYKGTG